jgi:glyoxylase-like metal-dependent hydrolase (beta-lactamase superfamily II)
MQLTEHVHLVGSGLTGFSLSDPLDCHVYLVDGRSELALIDAGAGRATERILDEIRDAGLDPGRIRHLLLTHLHADHAAGAADFRRRLPGLRIYAAHAVASYLRNGDERAINLHIGKQAGFYPEAFRFEPCPVDVEVREGMRIEIGALAVEALETPGHCAGHLSFLLHGAGRCHLFAGDTIFHGGRILLQNIDDCDLQAHIRSLRKLAGLSVDVLLPGHFAVSLHDGQEQIRLATRVLDRGLIPPSVF